MNTGTRKRTDAEPEGFLRRYVFSTDHKTIGKQYLGLSLLAVFAGIILSWLMRMHLGWPMFPISGLQILSPGGAPSGIITPEYYLSLMTMHATLMVFFVLTTAPIAAFGNYFLPIQIGARNIAFPRLSMLSFWITAIAFVTAISSFFIQDGPPISGWTAYPPLSAVGGAAGPGEGLGQTLWLISISIFCIGQILLAINFISTTLDLRAKGMTLVRMPVTVWTWFVTSVMILLSFSALLPACLLLILDRTAGTSFFVPAGLMISDQLQPHAGGTPLLWQHLFWFFGHPEVYIAILPTVGIVSLIFPTFVRKPILGPRIMIGCALAIGLLSFLVWGHHMFVSGMNPFSAIVFSLPTMLITVPSSILVLLWIGTLYGARLRLTTAGLFCLAFVSVFVTGGVTGFFLAQPSLDSYLHATYFVVAHFHFVMGVAAIFGIFAGTYFWFPKMFGRMMSESMGKWHFWLTFIGVYCIFLPMYFLGFAGNVRRYSYFTDDYMVRLIPVHKFITIAALLTGIAQFIFLFNLAWSRFRGRRATDNPWEATTLEWSISSPPSRHNFPEQVVVRHGPDEYGIKGSDTDYIMQISAAGGTD